MKTNLLIPSIGFLALYLFLFPLLLFVLQVAIQYRNLYQQNIFNPSHSYITQTLSIEEYQKFTINNKKEIILNGQIYDIVSSTQNQSTITLKLYRDIEEQSILNLLKNILHQKKNNFHSFFFFEIIASPPCYSITFYNIFNQIQKHYIPHSFNLCRAFIEKNTPPPKFVL